MYVREEKHEGSRGLAESARAHQSHAGQTKAAILTRIAQRSRQIFAWPLASCLARSKVGVDHRNTGRSLAQEARQAERETVKEQAAWIAINKYIAAGQGFLLSAAQCIDFQGMVAPCDGRPTGGQQRLGRTVIVQEWASPAGGLRQR